MSYTVFGRNINRVTGQTEKWEYGLDALALGSSVKSHAFRGRPALAQRILRAFEQLHRSGSRATAQRSKSNLYYFWRFLDQQEELSRILVGVQPVNIDDLDWEDLEAIWRQFINWLKSQPAEKMSNRARYYINATTHNVFREAHKIELEEGKTGKQYLDIYIYFRDKQSSSYGDDPIDYEEAKGAFKILARQWRASIKRIDEGRSLANTGRDPLVGRGGAYQLGSGPWQALENRLWIVANTLPFGKLHRRPEKTLNIINGCTGSQLPEGMRPDYNEDMGMWAHVPALFFTWREIAIAFAMVCMKTGMNPDSVARMTTDSWFRPDPLHPGKRVILFGPKRIPGKILKASSSVARKTDAYQIMLKIIEVTKPLRDRMEELASETGDPKLAEMAKLIWIWPSPGSDGVNHLMPGTSANDQMHRFLDRLFERHDVKRKSGEPLRFRFGMGRDIWGLFVYHKSGFNHLLTAQALGHSTLRSLLHYLEKRTVKINDRKRLIDLQGRVLTDLAVGQYVPQNYRDPITSVRSSTGLNCTDLTHPSPEADPGNPGGRVCRKQNCWACFNWYATTESLPFLIRMVDDLYEIRDVSSVGLWEASEYPEMLAVYEHIIAKFHRDHVADAREGAATMAPIITTTRFTTAARAFQL